MSLPLSLIISRSDCYHALESRLLVIFFWTQVVLLMTILVLLIAASAYHQPTCLSSPPDCGSLMAETLVQLCTNYRTGIFAGELCSKMCEDETGTSLVPVSCPDFSVHSGKTCVLEVKDLNTSSPLIIKSRTLTIEELTGKELPELLRQSATSSQSAIFDLVDDRFPAHQSRDIQSILSQTFPQNSSNFSSIPSQTELLNAWLLLQDNEYLLSSSRTADRLFPPVIGTCGHFYAVQYVHRVLDFSYFVPSALQFFYQFRSTRERLQLALDLLHFLRRFRQSSPKLELCDLKYSHFGYLEDSTSSGHQQPNWLVLLDSDLILPAATVAQSISLSSAASCTSDDDCHHLVDCQGECHQARCRPSPSDTDLRRLCRNLFFMGRLPWWAGRLQLGLLASLDEADEEEAVGQLKYHCFEAEQSQESSLDSVEAVIKRVLSRL